MLQNGETSGDMLLPGPHAGNWELHYTQTEPDTLLIVYETWPSSHFAGKNINLILELPKGTVPRRFLPTGRDWSRLSRFSSTMPSPILGRKGSTALKMYKKKAAGGSCRFFQNRCIEVADTEKGADEIKQNF